MLEARSPARLTLSQRAYEAIKEALCQGKFSPGDILSESQLAAQLGMSRTPVREALRTLASEDWLEIRNGIGAYVKPLSAKDIEDLYEVRCLLEVQAARTAVSRITEEEIDSLDLSALTEFKRSGNGTVEIKLMDRVAVLEKIAAMLEQREEDEADAFLQALERSGDQKAGAEAGGEAIPGRGE